MNDKIAQFFSVNDFDIQEPTSGHENRFEQKLNKRYKKPQKPSWYWLSAAASVVLIIGFWLGANVQKQTIQLADVSPKMEEVENYFVSSINQEIKTLEKNRNLETEMMIEQALHQLEELEDDYQLFVKALKTNGLHQKIINAMIKNYQKRLEILENVSIQIQKNKNLKNTNDEIYL